MSTILLRRIFTTNIHSRSHPTYKFAGRLRLSTRTTTPPPPQNTPRVRTLITTVSLATFLSLTTYTLGVIFPPSTLSILFPRPAPAPSLDPKSPESVAYTESLESTLQSLPLLQSLRTQVDANEWYEARPYLNFPEEKRVNNFTAGALRGSGKLALHPLVRARKDESESLVFVHFGRGLCGHDGIVHGGVLATLLDETLARTAFNNLPDKLAVTANLSLNYRAPTRADQFVVIKTALVEIKGRKAVVSGRVEDLQGKVLVEATGTFVQPRYAKLLNTDVIRQAMGEPQHSHEPVHLADGAKLKAK